MTPNYPYLIDLNQDHNHHVFTSKFQASCSSSSSSTKEQVDYYQYNTGSQEFQNHEEAKMCGTTSEKIEDKLVDSKPVKWISSKMKLTKKIISPSSNQPPPGYDQTADHPNNNPIIRVCSDCNTTKTPLWRSGPKGPKSLCNACGIRQRKARRAIAAAAADGSTADVVRAPTTKNNNNKVQEKGKSIVNYDCVPQQTKKKRKLVKASMSKNQSKQLCFDDLAIILGKNSSFHRVFPQDEKEGAILLMALSYGLVHG